jgi:dihydrodipicolinate reductase
MSIVLRREHHDDLRRQLEEVEIAHTALARAHEAQKAEFNETLELLVLMTVPAWLRDHIQRARASGWIVVVGTTGVEFNRPDADDHSYRMPVPLPENDAERSRRRADLEMRIRAFEQRAA